MDPPPTNRQGKGLPDLSFEVPDPDIGPQEGVTVEYVSQVPQVPPDTLWVETPFPLSRNVRDRQTGSVS